MILLIEKCAKIVLCIEIVSEDHCGGSFVIARRGRFLGSISTLLFFFLLSSFLEITFVLAFQRIVMMTRKGEGQSMAVTKKEKEGGKELVNLQELAESIVNDVISSCLALL